MNSAELVDVLHLISDPRNGTISLKGPTRSPGRRNLCRMYIVKILGGDKIIQNADLILVLPGSQAIANP